MFDIVIRNGWVADGTGNPADVAIQGDRIAAVGRLPKQLRFLCYDASSLTISSESNLTDLRDLSGFKDGGRQRIRA